MITQYYVMTGWVSGVREVLDTARGHTNVLVSGHLVAIRLYCALSYVLRVTLCLLSRVTADRQQQACQVAVHLQELGELHTLLCASFTAMMKCRTRAKTYAQ